MIIYSNKSRGFQTTFTGYIELPQTQNRYAYCINNPLKYIDPLGLCHGYGDVYLYHKYNAYEFTVHYKGMYYYTFLPEGLGWRFLEEIDLPTLKDYPDLPIPPSTENAGDVPPRGGAPADETYTFPKYKFQHYTPPVVPELRAQPSIYEVLAQRSSQTLTPLPNEKTVLLTTVVSQHRMLRQMQASLLVGFWLWGYSPPLAAFWLGFSAAAIGLGPRYEAEMIIENKRFGE